MHLSPIGACSEPISRKLVNSEQRNRHCREIRARPPITVIIIIIATAATTAILYDICTNCTALRARPPAQWYNIIMVIITHAYFIYVYRTIES